MTVKTVETLAVAGEPEPVIEEPLAGDEIATVGAVLSAVKVTDLVSEPPALVAATVIVWLPSARLESESGLVQAAAEPLSILQVTLVGEFVAVNVSDADVWLTTALGVGAVIVTTGAEVGAATEKVVLADPVLPARSVAVTVIV